jgi:hypothetical protein
LSLLIALITIFAAGCSSKNIKDTDVRDTAFNREIVEVVERYRRAIETRDSDALKAMLSRRYYENASTTETDQDDYGYDVIIKKILPMLSENVERVFFQVRIKNIKRKLTRTLVTIEYVLRFRYNDGQETRWAMQNDVNQLEFVLEDNVWRIRTGS